jgi:hypothetical protein
MTMTLTESGGGSALNTLSTLRLEDPKLRVIGDVHGAYAYYDYLADNAPYSLAVGDMGWNPQLIDQDPRFHRAIAGNHEVYDPEHPKYYKKFPVFLGDWGTHEVPGLPPIFYVRGAWSIDWKKRAFKFPPEWWAEEELSIPQLNEVIEAYCDIKPEIVVSHEAPLDVVHLVTDARFARDYGYDSGVIKSKTNQAFQAMLENHRPKRWIFGHYHKRRDFEIDGTQFTCLDMLRSGEHNLPNSYIDLY